MFRGYLLLMFPVVALLSLLIYTPVYFGKKKQYGKRPFIRHLAIYTFLGVVISILHITIFLGGYQISFKQSYYFLNLRPFIWVRETYDMGVRKMLEQLLLNTLMTIPLGVIFPIVFEKMRKFWKTIVSIACFILLIETFQYFIGRSADIDDLIMNSIGGAIGYGIFRICNCLFKNKKTWRAALNQS